MRQSKYFFRTQKEFPKDESSVNARLLIRANFVDKLMAGVYTFLPLGWKVMKKIENIIREEINAIGGQELFMPSLQPKENWTTTGRWDSMDDLYKVQDKSDREFALGPTHEEIISPLVKKFINSYKDLPVYLYQFQNKFRMELRAKSGLIRGREFIMKDLYSFHVSQEDLDDYYQKATQAYKNIFQRAGIGEKTFVTVASGGSFSKYSHEFQTISPAGEDEIYICNKCSLAVNKEIKAENEKCQGCGADDFRQEKAIEVGNIFKLGTKYSAPFNLAVKDDKGENQTVIMGCYGIGLSRLMGTIAEVHNDERGLIWPAAVAPFDANLLLIGEAKSDLKVFGEKIYQSLAKNSVDVLYDDREGISAGEKFADADLIGIPWRLVVSEKTLAAGKVEIKKRGEKESELLTLEQISKKIK